MRPDKMTEAAQRLLGNVVRFFRPAPDALPVRAIVGQRWATPEEWALLLRRGLAIAPSMIPPPERGRREAACPCPGCGRCCCRFVGATGLGDRAKVCRRAELCVCPRVRAAVRLDFRRVNMERGELVLTRSGVVLDTLGTWTVHNGWDFSPAGDGGAPRLGAVIDRVLSRNGTALALRARGAMPPAPAEAA